jgi:hypothetical protein
VPLCFGSGAHDVTHEREATAATISNVPMISIHERCPTFEGE